MCLEGVLRHLVFDRGRWADAAVYAILHEEYPSTPRTASRSRRRGLVRIESLGFAPPRHATAPSAEFP
jgi:hypothetical protein